MSGGIAAYKAVEVCRRLFDAGAHVTPVLTPAAVRFVGAVTFSAVASEPARTGIWDDPDPIPHTRLGQGADLVLVVPATADLLARYAAGMADDLLTATLLATRAPVLVCPAMHTEMWEHPSVADNLATLRRRGVHVLEPATGRLAGGDVGTGRLAEPEEIVAAADGVLSSRSRPTRRLQVPSAGADQSSVAGDLAGRRVLVTAGGTREAIDPVRVITNRSSGKQGYALADRAARRGAEVVLVSTVDRPTPPGVEIVRVVSAEDMEQAVMPRAGAMDVVIMAAAVADFRPKVVAERKIKKGDGLHEIVLEPTHDFLEDLGRQKPGGQVLVGFAAETDSVEDNARAKLSRKRLDLIVANDVAAAGVGFEHDTNSVLILGADGSRTEVPLTTKEAAADAVLDAVSERLRARPAASRSPEEPTGSRSR